MKLTLLIAVTAATLITGNASRAQSITLDASTAIGRQALCQAKWKQLKEKDKKSAPELQAVEYGSQYFVKVCKRELRVVADKK